MLPAAAASASGYANPTPGNINSGTEAAASNHVGKSVRVLVAENAVTVFGRKGCCMCHVVKLLLQGHGANPTVLGFDERDEADVSRQLLGLLGLESSTAALNFPAVFVGGELLGGLDEIMKAHITGGLVPRLKAAGALWL